MKEINISVPFVFSRKIDPHFVHTVGDQMVAEHIFSYFNTSLIQRDHSKNFSKIHFDSEKNQVLIKMNKGIVDSNGIKLAMKDICKNLFQAFQGTQHTDYRDLLDSISCTDEDIVIEMKSIPVNLENWLRMPDFAITSKSVLKDNVYTDYRMTGPYELIELSTDKVRLKRNMNFPSEFTSNQVDLVNIDSYSNLKVNDVIQQKRFDLIYLYGHSITNDDILSLKKNGFKIKMFPNEWLIYVGFQPHVSFEERVCLSQKLELIRNEVLNNMEYSSPAYSLTPSNSAFGISTEEYDALKPEVFVKNVSRKLTIGTLDEWASGPVFDLILKRLKQIDIINLKIFDRNNFEKIFLPEEVDMFLTPIGVSSVDPLGNLSFLHRSDLLFKESLDINQIKKLYSEKDFSEFKESVKEIEIGLLKQRCFFPIAYFPGVIVESSRMARDAEKSWDWGIQAWTYSESV